MSALGWRADVPLFPFVSSEVETPIGRTLGLRGISTSLDANGLGGLTAYTGRKQSTREIRAEAQRSQRRWVTRRRGRRRVEVCLSLFCADVGCGVEGGLSSVTFRVERSRDTHRKNAWPEGHLDFARCERVGRAYGLYRSKTVVPRNSRRGAEIAEKIVYAEARSRGEAGSGRQARVPLRRCGILQCFRKKAAWRRAFLSASPRSEEHTSELQSLMRNSYAVFCLKNKRKKQPTECHAHIKNIQQHNHKR